MNAGLFRKLKPNRGHLCKVVWIRRSEKFTENCIKFNGFDKHGNGLFGENLTLDISKIIYIKKLIL